MGIVTEKKFLTQEEIQSLKQIQFQTQSLILELGEIEMVKIQLENRHQLAKQTLNDLSNQEKSFTQAIFETYGKCSIDPETGEITNLD